MYYEITKLYGGKAMKPRVFVSSTFYDLKYIREDLANFIRVHDFEPILFEDGDIGYTPGQSLDKSCYDTMKNADMVIVIIGGNYGSPASGEKKDDFEEYMSVTRKEFREAVEEGVPLYVFVDRKVYSEYEVYELNIENIEEKNKTKRQIIKFKSTKDINVFRFIKEIKSISNISVVEFDKIVDIKEFLSKQWSDMFKIYLNTLKEKQANERVEKAVEQMQALIKKMDIMLDAVGKKTLSSEDSDEYNMVIDRQKVLLFCNNLINNISIKREDCVVDNRAEQIEYCLKIILEASNTGLFQKVISGINSQNKTQENEAIKEIFEYMKKENVVLRRICHSVAIEIEKNKEILEKESLRKIMIEELSKESNYIQMFE